VSEGLTLVSKPSACDLALDLAAGHPHFTRLQRARGAMDPAVKTAFEELIRRFDSFDAKWEAKFADAETLRREREDEANRRLAALESLSSSVPGAAIRLTALEDYCVANSEAAVAAEEWNRGISNRVG